MLHSFAFLMILIGGLSCFKTKTGYSDYLYNLGAGRRTLRRTGASGYDDVARATADTGLQVEPESLLE